MDFRRKQLVVECALTLLKLKKLSIKKGKSNFGTRKT